jgi:monoamine oxidase
MDDQIIIIGAGAAGLMAARGLLRSGRSVTILESADRIGGRIYTLDTESGVPFELGAEFVHGDLPVTLSLLKEYGIGYQATGWSMVELEEGEQKKQPAEGRRTGWKEMLHQMASLADDQPLEEFLVSHFPGKEFASLRKSAMGFAQGFDVADPHDASTKSLFREWTKDEGGQYRVSGGYSSLTDALAKDCLRMGCSLVTSEQVVAIHWEKNRVKVLSRTGKEFSGSRAVITTPLVMLDHQATGSRGMTILPELPRYLQAARQIGYGSVIKILLEFSQPVWKKKAPKARFIFTGEVIPTWWTRYPDASHHLITGWIGGPRALELKDKTDEMVLLVARLSLASVFGIPQADLASMLVRSAILNWGKHPHSLGAYSYPMVGTDEARVLLSVPVENTIYLSGEAVYSGSSQGTVEAALASGLEAAEKVLGSYG